MKEGKVMIEIKDLNIFYVDKKISMNILKEYNLFIGDNGNGKILLLDYILGVKKVKRIVIKGNESIIYIN